MARSGKWTPLLVTLVALAAQPNALGGSGCQTVDPVGTLVDAAKGAVECDAAAVWKHGSVTFKVLNRERAAELLGTSDSFTQAMTTFDFQARMQRSETHTEESYLQYAASSAQEWQPEELANVEAAVRRFMTLTSEFNLPLPPEILIVKSSGREEFGAAYTRGNAMVLPIKVVRSPEDSSTFVDHETYHILTRYSPAFRADMNQLLGFRVGPGSAPEASPSLRTVTNPDLGVERWLLDVVSRGAPLQVTPVLYSKYAAADVRSVASFRYAFATLGPDGAIVTDGGGRFVDLHPDVVAFHERIGVPRYFPLHPEELMALVFESLLDATEDEQAAPALYRPALLDEILSTSWFRGEHTTQFADSFPAIARTSAPDHELFPTRRPLNWDEASSVVQRLAEIYGPMAQERGKTLELDLEWLAEWDQASAYNYTHSDRMSVRVGGGLARNPMMTQDTFAKILCHELGHLFGGAPMRKSPMKEQSSVELQADYWSTAKCLKAYFAVDGDENLRWVAENPTDPLAKDRCERQFRDPVQAAVCSRSIMASLNEIRMLESYSRGDGETAALSTPSTKRVSIIERYYTDTQCRLDTLFQGALCNRSHTIPASDTDAEQGFCNRSDGDRLGVRPRCWYRAGAPVHEMGKTSY